MKSIVIGAGMSGLCIGLILKKEGFEPVIYEKNKYAGGSFNSYRLKGYQIDTGLHFLTRAESGELPQLMRKYLGEDVFDSGFTSHKTYNFTFRGVSNPLPEGLGSLLKTNLFTRKGKLGFIRMFFDFLSLGRDGTESYKGYSPYDYIEKYVPDEKSFYFLNALCWMCSGSSLKDASLFRFVDGVIGGKTMKDFLPSPGKKKYPPDYYPVGGLKALPELFVRKGGLDVRADSNVERIYVKDGKVTGVLVGGKRIPADIVVYGGLVSELPGLVDGLSKEEIRKFKDIKEYKAITLWVGFREKVADWKGESLVKVQENLGSPHWAVFLTDLNPDFAPKGHQLLGMSAILHKDKDEMVREMEQTLEEMLPGCSDKIDLKYVQVMRAEKALQDKSHPMWDLPDHRTSIRGLYLVGTDTKGYGNGGTLCADSARRCFERIREDSKVY